MSELQTMIDAAVLTALLDAGIQLPGSRPHHLESEQITSAANAVLVMKRLRGQQERNIFTTPDIYQGECFW